MDAKYYETFEKCRNDKDLRRFLDWFDENLGWGYGTGETPTIFAIGTFFELLDNGLSDYKKLENVLGTVGTWFLINLLCKTDVVDYGTSPRGCFISGNELGKSFNRVFKKYTEDELYEMTNFYDRFAIDDYFEINKVVK